MGPVLRYDPVIVAMQDVLLYDLGPGMIFERFSAFGDPLFFDPNAGLLRIA
jgi:hypothetical protein